MVGATNATLTLPEVDPSASGGYSVRVIGGAGTWTSTIAQIQVMAAPAIVASPPSLRVLRGAEVRLEVSATGPALSYQWQLNGFQLEGATNSTLVLPDAQPFQAGAYSVIVSNPVGSVASAPSVLTVDAPPVLLEIVSSSMTTNGFQLTLNADPGFRYALDTSTDLSGWQPLATLSLDAGLENFTDFDSTNFWNRFYRLRWVP